MVVATLTKSELSRKIAQELSLTVKDAQQFVEDFFESIADSLEQGENVKLSNFGIFELRNKDPRPGRNPRTGEDKVITARRVVAFRASQKLKDRVKDFNEGQPSADHMNEDDASEE